jgi:hypothetical protein
MPPRRARVLLGASQKVGKTTLLGTWAPNTTLIVDTQNGTLLLDGQHYVQHVANWTEFVSVVDDIVRGNHMFHTVGLDLVNDIWRFADRYHGKGDTPASAMDDYGRSSAKAQAAFTGQIGRLLAAPIGIWFLTHLTPKTDKTGELTVYKPDLNKNVNGYLEGAVDFLWLAEVVNGKRVIHTQPTKHFEAGSRVPMPSPIPMDARAIATAMDRALNPESYNEDGTRKGAEPEPATVPPTDEKPVETIPPERKDVKATGASDIPSDVDVDPGELAPDDAGVPWSEDEAVDALAAGLDAEEVAA